MIRGVKRANKQGDIESVFLCSLFCKKKASLKPYKIDNNRVSATRGLILFIAV